MSKLVRGRFRVCLYSLAGRPAGEVVLVSGVVMLILELHLQANGGLIILRHPPLRQVQHDKTLWPVIPVAVKRWIGVGVGIN